MSNDDIIDISLFAKRGELINLNVTDVLQILTKEIKEMVKPTPEQIDISLIRLRDENLQKLKKLKEKRITHWWLFALCMAVVGICFVIVGNNKPVQFIEMIISVVIALLFIALACVFAANITKRITKLNLQIDDVEMEKKTIYKLREEALENLIKERIDKEKNLNNKDNL